MRGKSITVASVIGPHTVTSEPTWSWTSLMQVNWSAHIRLQLKSRNHDCKDFTRAVLSRSGQSPAARGEGVLQEFKLPFQAGQAFGVVLDNSRERRGVGLDLVGAGSDLFRRAGQTGLGS